MNLAPLALALLPLADDSKRNFDAEVHDLQRAYEAVLESNEALLRDGRLAEATQALIDVVPEEQRSAAHWFLLGNFLFEQDFAASYALHQKAFELAPEETNTQYEWALERHRKREYAEAEALYAKLAAAPGDANPGVHALRADCLLHLGRLKEAVAAWKSADPRSRHSAIEQAFSWVYGAPHPLVERARLLGEVRGGGNLAAVEELLLLDLAWQTDWWNARPNQECLAPDLALAAEKLGAATPRYQQLALLVELSQDEGPKGSIDADRLYVKRLRDRRVAGADVPLAENSHVAGRLLDLLESAQAVKAADLLRWYEEPLRARVDATPADPQALEILAAFYEKAGQDDDLAAIEEIGWTKFGAAACAAGILARKGDELQSDDELLKAALAKYPADQHLCGLAVDCAMRERKGEREAIVACLEAHLAHLVSWNDGAQRGFLVLEKLLAK